MVGRSGRRTEAAVALVVLLIPVAVVAFLSDGGGSRRPPSAAIVDLAQGAVYARENDMALAGQVVRRYVDAGTACARSNRYPCVVSGDNLTFDFGRGRYVVDVAPMEGISKVVRHVAVEEEGVIHVVDPQMFREVLIAEKNSVLSSYTNR